MSVIIRIFQGNEGKEAFQETIKVQDALKVKEALQETLQEALKEALQEALKDALRLQELRGFVPLYGRNESFRYGGDGDRALRAQVGFITIFFSYLSNR